MENAIETARKPPQRQKKKKIAGYQLPDNHTWANRVNFAKVQKEMKQVEEGKQSKLTSSGQRLIVEYCCMSRKGRGQIKEQDEMHVQR